MKLLNKLAGLNKYAMAISFLAMEIFALMAFSFGDNYVLYGSLSLALVVLLILFNIKQITVDGISTIAFFFLPLFLFALICSFGNYFLGHYLYLGTYSLADLVFIPLGLLPICFAGYVLSIDKTFKISTFLIVIYSALATIVVINLLVNLVNFGAFYSLIYKGYHMYYAGEMASVTVDQIAYTLEGFKFIEVKMGHYVMYPALLLTCSIALFYLSPKSNRKLFVIYACFTGVALLALILVPSLLALIVALLILAIDGVIFVLRRFTDKLMKPAKITLYVLIALASIVFLVVFLNMQDYVNLGVKKVVSGNAFLNKLFSTNRVVSRYNYVVENVLTKERYLGYGSATNSVEPLAMSGSLMFDSFMFSGVFGFIALVVMFIVGYRGFVKYFKYSKGEFYEKALLIAFVAFFFIFINLFYEAEYGIFYSIHHPVMMSGPFMIMIFIFSYVTARGGLDTPKKIEVEVKEETINA